MDGSARSFSLRKEPSLHSFVSVKAEEKSEGDDIQKFHSEGTKEE